MRYILLVIAVVIVVGCGKRGTDDKPEAKAQPPAEKPKPAPKKEEPPQLSPRHKIKTNIREIAKVAITDDGSRVAASSDGLGNKAQIEIWDLSPEPKKLRDIPGVLRAFSPDGELLTRAGKGYGETEVVDAATGAVLCVISNTGIFQHFVKPDKLVTVVPSEHLLKGKQGTLFVRTFDARNGSREFGFEIPSSEHADLRGPVNGRTEIVVGWDSTARVEVWNLSTGKRVRGATLANARLKAGWRNFEASPDGKRVTASQWLDKPVGLYDIATGAEVATVGFGTTTTIVPGRDLILQHVGGWRAYDLTKKAVVAELPGSYFPAAIPPDGKVMVTRVDRARPEFIVWDLTRIP